MKFHEKLMKSHTILVRIQAEYDTARMVGRRLEAALCMTMSTYVHINHVKTKEGNWMRGRKRHYPVRMYLCFA